MALTQGPLRVVLLTDKTSGMSMPIDVSHYSNVTIYLKGEGTISAGTLIVEEADYVDAYAGSWSDITGDVPIDCTEVTGGAQKAYQVPIGAYGYLRARIGTTISGAGGSISVVLRCN